MVSCGTQNTGSNADNEALSVLDLLLQQDNFEASDFGLPYNPDVAGDMVDQEELDADDEKKDEIIPDDTPIENPVIPTPPESLPPTGEMKNIRNPGDYNKWKSTLSDSSKCFPTSETPIYPIKIFRYKPAKYDKETGALTSAAVEYKDDQTTVIINPTSVVDMCQRIKTDPEQSKNKMLVIHTDAGSSGTHHGMIKGSMQNNWKHPGYHISIDVEGYCNSNRLDNENTYGCKNNKSETNNAKEGPPSNYNYSPYKNKELINGENVSTRKSDSIQIINISWLGSNANIGNPYANKASGDWLTAATMTKKQAHSLSKLVKAFIKKYPNIQIGGHNQLGPKIKDCPCFNVPKWLELCGVPSKNRYETFHNLAPNHKSWKTTVYTDDNTTFVKNSVKMFKELGDISTWNIIPPTASQPPNNSNPSSPVSTDVDSFGNPVKGSPNFKDFKDMDCSEFKIFYYNIRDKGPLSPTKNLQAFSSGLDIEGRSDFDDKSYQCQDTF